MGKSKEPIRLRRRKMPSGLTSLYLDIYLDGKRKYEWKIQERLTPCGKSD